MLCYEKFIINAKKKNNNYQKSENIHHGHITPGTLCCFQWHYKMAQAQTKYRQGYI